MRVRGRVTPIVGVALALLPASPIAAQDDGIALPRLSDSTVVSLISILPGDDVYSVFGHTMVRIRDERSGVDSAYNFGTFDFGDSPAAMASFLARFTYGDLNYKLDVWDGARTVAGYWQLGRASIEQTLDVTPDEARELFRRLEVNALPENAFYQYDFFFDNCATRPLDVLEAVLGPRLSFEGAPDPGLSFRRLLDPYLTGAPWVDLGMDLGLGVPADRQATPREATFLPERLMAYVAAGMIDRGADGVRPLVRDTRTLTGPASPSWAPEPAAPWPALVGWLLFAAGTALTWRDGRAGRRARPAIDALFFGVLGVAGLAVTFLWFVSLHDVTKTNLNLAWALPTHLAAAVALARGAAARGWGWYFAATALLALGLLAGMPVWPQELPAALIPLLALIVVRATWLARVRLLPGRSAGRTVSRPASPP